MLRFAGRGTNGRLTVAEYPDGTSPIAPLGTPFTSTTGVLSGTSASWVDVLTTGVVIIQNVTGLTPQTARATAQTGACGCTCGRPGPCGG